MRGSGFRTPATADSTRASKCGRSTPVPSPSVIQLLVTAAARRPRARMRRIASSIAGRGTVTSADAGHHRARVDRVPGRGAVLLERRVERLERELAALEARPRARGTRRHHHAVDEAGGDALLRLVARDRLERGADDDPAQIEEDGPVVHRWPSLADAAGRPPAPRVLDLRLTRCQR